MSTLSTVLITAVAALTLLPASPAAAQPAASPAAATMTSDLPPAPAAAMTAYRTIEPWVRALQAPDASPEGLPPVVGAAVILRSGGQIVGRGGSISQSPDPAAIWLAARDAIAEARRRLPPTKDLVAEEALKETVAAITISLELAGPLTPILPEPATWPDAELLLSPGLDGVAVRLGQGPDAPISAIFPSQMIPTNTMPHQALAAAASQVGRDATMGVLEPKELREKHGAAMFRFRTTHLAQAAPRDEPLFLQRGHRWVSVAAVTTDELRRLAERIVGAFVAIGNAEQSKQLEELPQPEQRDLAGLAVGAFGRTIRPLSHAEEQGLAFLVLDDSKPSGIVDVAVTVCGLAPGVEAILQSRRAAGQEPGPLHEVWGEQAAALASAFSREEGFRADVPAGAHGLVALAMTHIAMLETLAGEPARNGLSARDLAEAMVRRVFRDTPETQLVSQMPWLGWAELRLADVKAQQDPAAPRDIPSAIALRRMREQVWQHMLTEADCGPDNPDLVGGIVFTKSKVLLPTWQSARPLAFIATMLGDPRLTEPQEFNTELVRLLTALRFLRQLQADEATMWMFPNRDRALGGIRAAAWDQRMPIDASAMTLLAVCETLKSLEARAKMQAEQPPAGQGQSSASPK